MLLFAFDLQGGWADAVLSDKHRCHSQLLHAGVGRAPSMLSATSRSWWTLVSSAWSTLSLVLTAAWHATLGGYCGFAGPALSDNWENALWNGLSLCIDL